MNLEVVDTNVQFDFSLPTTSQSTTDKSELYYQVGEKSWLKVVVTYNVTPLNPPQ
jgi:hypothetical protein